MIKKGDTDLEIINLTKKDLKESFAIYHKKINNARVEIEKVVKGQSALLNSVLRGFICGGNILLEGLPGLGKTVLCRVIAEISHIQFKRVQFTTDLLPSDIVGIMSYDKERGFEVVKGPIFTNLMLADEINRAPPKVQSALLEAMGEHQVTLGKETHSLPRPFLVIATQNPIETAGTYPLPEAQVDRFLFKINVEYPDYDSEYTIMQENLNSKNLKDFNLKRILSSHDITAMQGLAKLVHIDMRLRQYILEIIRATRNPHEIKAKSAPLLRYGASPRASISLLIAAKAQAMVQGRHYVVPQDIKDVIHEVLRHRIVLNFKAKMENVDTDKFIDEILEKIDIY